MPRKTKPRPFIVIESINGAGGSTQANQLVARLKREGYKPLSLHFHQREKGTGQLIQKKFLDTHNQPAFSRREQALLYIQDFFSAKETIEKALAASPKSAVVSDRFYGSTMAYQTLGLPGKERRQVLDWIIWLTQKGAIRLPKPNLVILLDTPPTVSANRLKGQKKDFFENLKKLKAVRDNYLKVAREQKWVVVRSSDKEANQRPIQEIHEEIWQHVTPLL